MTPKAGSSSGEEEVVSLYMISWIFEEPRLRITSRVILEMSMSEIERGVAMVVV